MPAKSALSLKAYRIENAHTLPLAAVRITLPTRWVVLSGRAV